MLRAGTRAAHDQVDGLFSRYDLADAADYRRFLIAQAAAFLPVEVALDAAGAATLFPDWDERRRADLLRADLDALGVALPTPVAHPELNSPSAIAGAAYVLEGSRLGGAMLARSIADDLPSRFLLAPQPPGQWRAFLGQLERHLPTRAERDEAVTSARAVFDHFARAASAATDRR